MALYFAASETEESRTRGLTKRSHLPCPVCSKSQSSKNLRRHLHSHQWTNKEIQKFASASYNSKPPVSCPVCEKLLTRKGLRRHLKMAHKWDDDQLKNCSIVCYEAQLSEGEAAVLDECPICGVLVSFASIFAIFAFMFYFELSALMKQKVRII